MKLRGLYIDAYGCRCDLNDAGHLLAALVNASKRIQATVVKKTVHRYTSQGVSIVLLLAESHASIYTWPEYGYAAVEIVLCNDVMDPNLFWKDVSGALKPRRAKLRTMVRDVRGMS